MSSIELFGRAYAADKGFVAGTHRTRSPGETVNAYRPAMKALGITRLANITGLDHVGVPVVAAIRPNAAFLNTALGKGLTLDAALASALMESIETWHAEYVDLPLRLRRHEEAARRGRAIPSDAFPRRSEHVPRAASELWVQGHDLLAREPAWVPLDAVQLCAPGSWRFSGLSTSNGLASGNHLLEAVCHGLFELIERDAQPLWSARERGLRHLPSHRRVRLDTITDPACRQIIETIRTADLGLGVLDLTTDIGIPVYAALLVDRPGPRGARLLTTEMGFGCHLSPAIALSRALTEAAQARLTAVAGSRDNIERFHYVVLAQARRIREIYELSMDEGRAQLDFRSRADLATGTFQGDIALILERLRGIGAEHAVVVDLTREDLGIPIVKVLVPALEMQERLPRERTRTFMEQKRD